MHGIIPHLETFLVVAGMVPPSKQGKERSHWILDPVQGRSQCLSRSPQPVPRNRPGESHLEEGDTEARLGEPLDQCHTEQGGREANPGLLRPLLAGPHGQIQLTLEFIYLCSLAVGFSFCVSIPNPPPANEAIILSGQGQSAFSLHSWRVPPAASRRTRERHRWGTTLPQATPSDPSEPPGKAAPRSVCGRPGKAQAGRTHPGRGRGGGRRASVGGLSQRDHASVEVCPWGVQTRPLCFQGTEAEDACQARPWERGGVRTRNRGNPPRRGGAGRVRSRGRARRQEVAPGCRVRS